MSISKYYKKGLNIDLTYGQYEHLYKIMCSQEEIIDTLNESDDFDPQTFDNLFDAICAAKETYLPWKQHQKKKWLLTLWKRLLIFYQLVRTYPTQNFQCMTTSGRETYDEIMQMLGVIEPDEVYMEL